MKALQASFFNRPTVKVAKELIGCYLCRRKNGEITRYLITETEAYDGHEDLACHGSKGLTKRTAVLFGPPSRFYVYFTYGMHWLLNVVTGPEGYPAGVLIRGIDEVNGPARITKMLGIDGSLHGKSASKDTGLWFEMESKTPVLKIIRKERVGIDYAGEKWIKKKWRFILDETRQNASSDRKRSKAR